MKLVKLPENTSYKEVVEALRAIAEELETSKNEVILQLSFLSKGDENFSIYTYGNDLEIMGLLEYTKNDILHRTEDE